MGGTLPLPTSPFPFPYPCHLALMVHLLVPGQPPIPVEALIDFGASDSFLDPSILVRFNLHPLPHPVPISLELIEGSVPATGPITHYLPSHLSVHGVHTEALTFQITRLGHFQLVLGFHGCSATTPASTGPKGS